MSKYNIVKHKGKGEWHQLQVDWFPLNFAFTMLFTLLPDTIEPSFSHVDSVHR